MTNSSTDRRKSSRTPLAITIGVVVVLLIAFFVFASVYSEVLWFQQLGFLNVLLTQWGASAGFFVAGFIAMAVPVWLAIEIAYRRRPVYARLSSQLDRYQEIIEPLRRLLTFGVPSLLGLFSGISTATRWQTTMLYVNSTPSGTMDPQFGLDVSFYLFDLPFYQAVVGLFSAIILLSAIAALLTSYVYGSISIAKRELRVAKAARIQLAVLGALYIALQGVSLWLDQFAILTNASGLMTGADYADVNAKIPGLQILSVVAILVALLFVATALTGRWRLPVVGTALLVVTGLVLSIGYPWVVQRFVVAPSERSLEAPYIARNIDMTREAYGVANVQEIPYNAKTNATPGALRADAETTASIRIIDPALVSASFAQLEQFRQYYAFPSDLSVDRYTIAGKSQDAVVAVRELNQAGIGAKPSWYNNTVVYTHGYGLVAAYGTEKTVDGQPVFLESGIPSSGSLGTFEPRVYFGARSPQYSIVGGAPGSNPVELDYPAAGDTNQQTYTTFAGDGGPKLDNIFKRLVYALKFQSEEIILSDAVTNNSQILYDRNPLTRVGKVAPYLTLDSDPYPSVVDNKMVWIVDGYTTSANYPYSRVESLSAAIADSATTSSTFALDNVNYIRNSVKATVDAFDGKVTLYAWDENDPILKTWQKIYPANTKPISEMTGQLLSHVRYPADLFKAQRAILGQYHVTDPGSFYSRDDAWITPNNPTAADTKVFQPPYYLTMQAPGQDAPVYSIYSTFIPDATGTNSRNVLTGYLVADSDAGSTAGAPAAGYGKLRLLTLPRDVTVPGPGQVQNNFNSNPQVSTQLNLLSQGSTTVLRGNLLTLPVGGGLLYVQPVYVQSTGNTSYPLLRKMLVAFGDKIAFEDTLPKALDVLFGGSSGVNAPTNSSGTPSTGTPTTGTGTATPTVPNAALAAALQDAKTAISDREKARIAGNWTAFGEADARLSAALDRAIAASTN